MLKAVIFDKDGVLVDTETLIIASIDETLHKYGSNRPYNIADRVKHGGMPAQTTFPLLAKEYSLTGDIQDMIKHYQDFYTQLIQDKGVVVFDGVRDLLTDLKNNGIKLGIGTGSPKFRAEMTMADLGPFFETIVTSDQVENPKPAPDTFLLAAERLGVAASECIVVGDAKNDANGARDAGMKFIFRSSLAPKDVLEFEPDLTVSTMTELNFEKIKSLFI
jgi:HAD superfamily hydrolase (TIGR01509 family)